MMSMTAQTQGYNVYMYGALGTSTTFSSYQFINYILCI